jgi:hypothetical protein
MASIGLGGSGIGLPFPPSSYNNNATNGTNIWTLQPGQVYVIPSGNWALQVGRYSFLQFLDPISGLWRNMKAQYPCFINSDGANYRVVNATGCPVGAVVTNSGSGYTSAPVVTASAGGSTWKAIVGGAISNTVTIVSGGSNYTYAPTVVISPPPPGGIQATAVCTVSGGAVNSITVTNNGAGYKKAPTVRFIANPQDPNYATIAPATATTALGSSSVVSAVYPTSFGTPQTSLITLTFSGGGGSSAAATVVGCFAVTGLTTSAAGAAVPGAQVNIVGTGGVTTASAASGAAQPAISTEFFTPRQMVAYAPVSGGAVGTGVVVDGGLYQAAPGAVLVMLPAVASAALPTTAPAVTAAIGGVNDTFMLQPVL